MFDVCACEVGSGAERDEACAHDDTDDEGSEGELRYSKAPAALFVERDGELLLLLVCRFIRLGKEPTASNSK